MTGKKERNKTNPGSNNAKSKTINMNHNWDTVRSTAKEPKHPYWIWVAFLIILIVVVIY